MDLIEMISDIDRTVDRDLGSVVEEGDQFYISRCLRMIERNLERTGDGTLRISKKKPEDPARTMRSFRR